MSLGQTVVVEVHELVIIRNCSRGPKLNSIASAQPDGSEVLCHGLYLSALVLDVQFRSISQLWLAKKPYSLLVLAQLSNFIHRSTSHNLR